jgi:hypothetical protein
MDSNALTPDLFPHQHLARDAALRSSASQGDER